MNRFIDSVTDWRHWDDRLMDGLLWMSASTRRLVLVGVVIVLGAGWAYSLIEGAGPIEGPYWAVVTGTSTGYGDFSPASTAGRFVAMLLMVLMLLVVVPVWTAHVVGERDKRTGDAWSHEEQQQVIRDARVAAEGVAVLVEHVHRLEAALAAAGVAVPPAPSGAASVSHPPTTVAHTPTEGPT